MTQVWSRSRSLRLRLRLSRTLVVSQRPSVANQHSVKRASRFTIMRPGCWPEPSISAGGDGRAQQIYAAFHGSMFTEPGTWTSVSGGAVCLTDWVYGWNRNRFG